MRKSDSAGLAGAEPSGQGAGAQPDLARLVRSVRQRLELCRQFGWEIPLRRSRLASRKPAPRPGSVPPAPAPRPKSGPPAAASPATADATPPARPAASPAERARREELLLPLRQEVAACTRCGLCQGRTQTVFGVGDPATRLMFIGEAPGFDEDRQGEPFVGKAGRLLNDIIKAMTLRRDQVYIANIIKCRPPQNRVPNPAEVGACLGYLERQIEIVSPEIIVLLGSVAAKAILEQKGSMGQLRGRFHSYRGIPVMPTYHPAYLLRNPAEKGKVWDDMKLVMARLGLRRPQGLPEK